MFLAKFKRINDDSLATSERPDFYREGHRFDSDILHKVIYNNELSNEIKS